jgi:hypothetical protein
MLVVSLVALPSLAGQSKAQCVSLEHVRGAWQMQIKCDQGTGSITLVDAHGAKMYRGSGIFRHWSQQQLETMYQSLIPKDETSSIELIQLG